MFSYYAFVMQNQYHFLHMALIESLMLSSSALPASNFLAAYDDLLSFDDKARCLGIKREFEVVYRNCPNCMDLHSFTVSLHVVIQHHVKIVLTLIIIFCFSASPQNVPSNGRESVCECQGRAQQRQEPVHECASRLVNAMMQIKYLLT